MLLILQTSNIIPFNAKASVVKEIKAWACIQLDSGYMYVCTFKTPLFSSQSMVITEVAVCTERTDRLSLQHNGEDHTSTVIATIHLPMTGKARAILDSTTRVIASLAAF